MDELFEAGAEGRGGSVKLGWGMCRGKRKGGGVGFVGTLGFSFCGGGGRGGSMDIEVWGGVGWDFIYLSGGGEGGRGKRGRGWGMGIVCKG